MLKTARDLFTDEIEKIVIDDREQYQRLDPLRGDVHARARQGHRALRGRRADLRRLRHRGRDRARACPARSRSPSGGYLIIDQAEALTAIDVNTGRFVGKGSKDLEETILKTNLEAVEEIAYQLRFRNIGGLIMLDLIDMERASNREKVRTPPGGAAPEGQGQDDAEPHLGSRPHRDDAQAHAREPGAHSCTSRASTATAPGSSSRSRPSPTRSSARSAASA